MSRGSGCHSFSRPKGQACWENIPRPAGPGRPGLCTPPKPLGSQHPCRCGCWSQRSALCPPSRGPFTIWGRSSSPWNPFPLASQGPQPWASPCCPFGAPLWSSHLSLGLPALPVSGFNTSCGQGLLGMHVHVRCCPSSRRTPTTTPLTPLGPWDASDSSQLQAWWSHPVDGCPWTCSSYTSFIRVEGSVGGGQSPLAGWEMEGGPCSVQLRPEVINSMGLSPTIWRLDGEVHPVQPGPVTGGETRPRETGRARVQPPPGP